MKKEIADKLMRGEFPTLKEFKSLSLFEMLPLLPPQQTMDILERVYRCAAEKHRIDPEFKRKANEMIRTLQKMKGIT